MASHFSCIGLRMSSQQDFIDYLKITYDRGDKIRTKSGTYIKWNIGNGVEVWGQLDITNTAIGMNPHFYGNSRIKVRIENIIKRDNDNVLDGALYCWADPIEGKVDGAYPFVFDLPNYATYGNINIPQIVTAQITGFAHDITAFNDDEEFSKSQKTEVKFASESFIPAGLFNPNGEDTLPPQAMAIITGHVLETRALVNAYSDISFIYTRIKTLGGEYDIVVDPEILNGDIVVGGVVSGMFWLSGIIVGEYSKNETGRNKLSLFKLLKRD